MYQRMIEVEDAGINLSREVRVGIVFVLSFLPLMWGVIVFL